MHHANLLILEEVAALHQLIYTLDGELDGKHAARCRGMKCDPVMRIVEAYVGCVADPITDLAREHLRPESFAVCGRSGSKCDRLEPGDAGVSGREITPARVQRAYDQINRYPLRVEGQEGLDLASACFFGAPAVIS